MTPPQAPERTAYSWTSCVLLNLIFWTLAPLVTVISLLIASILTAIYAIFTRSRRKVRWLVRRSISHYGAAVLRCAWPFVKIKYVDLDPPPTGQPRDQGPFVFVANHRAASDGYLMAFLPHECVQIMNIWPSKIPVFGTVASIAQYMSVREMPFEDFLRQGSSLLEQGISIIAFPEGTRSGSLLMGPFHGSVFRLAMANNVKIVPLAIHGNEHIPPRGSFFLRPGRITVTRLPAITPQEYAQYNAYGLKTHVREVIQKHLDSLPA